MPRSSSALLLALPLALQAQSSWRSLDTFETPQAWRAAPSDGVSLSLAAVPGVKGHALGLDIDFKGGAGYAALRRPLPLKLPDNYVFRFWIRGNLPPNTLEFKLVDASGDNVWWVRRPDFTFRKEWTLVEFRRRHVTFAWGPLGGGEPRNLAYLELAVTAGQGGRGRVDVDELALKALPPERPYEGRGRVRVSGSSPSAWRPLGAEGHLDWKQAAGPGWLELDLGGLRTLGGLVAHWDPQAYPLDWDVEAADGDRTWRTLAQVREGAGGPRPVCLPDAEARFLRLRILRTRPGHGIALDRLEIRPLAYGASPNAFLQALAKEAPRGEFPRGFLPEQAWWTLVGVDGGAGTALLGEDGALEPGRGAFSVEPFLWHQGRLLRWSDVTATQSLAGQGLPIPSVSWETGDAALTVTALAVGPAGDPRVRARYRVENRSRARWTGTLFLALRPFQVNPPQQFLGTAGGHAPIHRLEASGATIRVDGQVALVAQDVPDGFGAMSFHGGHLLDRLREGRLPEPTAVEDATGMASGALRYDLDLLPGARREVVLDLPILKGGAVPPVRNAYAVDEAQAQRAWEEKLSRVQLHVPDPVLAGAARTALAHLLVSREGPALQPGTRAYRRSWIRDGALMGTVLLRMGHPEPVAAFLDWFTPHLFPDGKVPCVVDARGADPVPEHDSHGQFLYLVAEYDRFQKEDARLARVWPAVERVHQHLLDLSDSQRTEAFATGPNLAFRGLMPASISHEGYSAKPMHSYWDDFFALRGLKDAVYLAERTGHRERLAPWTEAVLRFRQDLGQSLALSMAQHRIPYLPGCAELGDFDATSTTVALSPGGELEHLPRAAVEATFESFWQQREAWCKGTGPSDRYTPYELRVVGSMIQLGWRERAHALLQGYLQDLRPRTWNQWPEVVVRDPRAPVFLGDLPHAWVASDFLRSLLTFFAYEREGDQSLVLGAGLTPAWLRSSGGAGIQGLRLPGGTLDLQAKLEGERVTWSLGGTLVPPPGGLVLTWPLDGAGARAWVDGRPVDGWKGGELVLRHLPTSVVMER